MWGRDFSTYSWMSHPQLTGQTLDMHCFEHGICYGNAEPFWLILTKDGHNELDHSPLSRVPPIPGMKSVSRIVLRSEFPYIKTILTASPPFALHRRKSVHLCLDLGRPLLRISCQMVLNHWFSLSNRNSLNVASARRFQGSARSPSQPIWDRSFINSFNSDFFLGMAGDTFLNGIGTCSISSSSCASGILLHALKLSTYSEFSCWNPTCYHYGIPTSQLLVIQKTTRHLFYQQCRLRKWLEGDTYLLKYPLPQRF